VGLFVKDIWEGSNKSYFIENSSIVARQVKSDPAQGLNGFHLLKSIIW